MLTTKTVFILGAGASAPYGFHTGSGLMNSLLGMNLRLRPPHAADLPLSPYECLVDAGFNIPAIAEFLDALGGSGRGSVDAFLEHRPDFLEVGKAAMAAVLLPCERHEVLFAPKGGDWYQYVFNKMNASFDELDRNDVVFLTFNYDRSLEYYLITAIRNAYRKTFAEAAAKVKKLKIVHLYGDLGELDEAAAQRWRTPTLDGAAVKAAASRIHIIHSAAGDQNFQVGRHWLERAEVVCFLGFGYHPINVKRMLDSISRGEGVRALGTANGMGVAERISAQAAVRKSFPGFRINQQNHTALEMLMNEFEWW